eukprot:787801_1
MAEAKQDESRRKIVVCGGGNACHVATGFAANLKDADVHLVSFFGDEAARFGAGLDKAGSLNLNFTQNKDKNISISKDKLKCSNDAKTFAGADMILIALPAFCHQQYLTNIAANLGDKKGTIIGVFPGGWGLELQFRSVLGDKSGDVILLTGQDLPWACRIKEFGSSVEILGTKQQIGAGVLIGKNLDSKTYNVDYVFNVMKNMIGAAPKLVSMGHVLAMSLSTNIVVHPSIMYSHWSKWDGKPLKTKPLFYQGLSKEGADIMIKMSDEIIAVSNSIIKYLGTKGIKIDITIDGIFKWYKDAYTNQASDISSLYRLIQTTKAYDGLVHPCVEMKEKEEEKGDDKVIGYGPNYKYRYLTEDLPYGLVVIKGYSMLLAKEYSVETPVLDQIIEWCQDKLGKEYFAYKEKVIVDVGKDINSSRAPQAYGFKDVAQAFS